MCGLLGPLDQDHRDQQAAQRPRQIDHVRVHQELVEVAAHIGDFRGGWRTQIDQQQRLLCHANFLTTLKGGASLQAGALFSHRVHRSGVRQ